MKGFTRFVHLGQHPRLFSVALGRHAHQVGVAPERQTGVSFPSPRKVGLAVLIGHLGISLQPRSILGRCNERLIAELFLGPRISGKTRGTIAQGGAFAEQSVNLPVVHGKDHTRRRLFRRSWPESNQALLC